MAQEAAHLVSDAFPKNLDIKYEKVCQPFMLLHVNRWSSAGGYCPHALRRCTLLCLNYSLYKIAARREEVSCFAIGTASLALHSTILGSEVHDIHQITHRNVHSPTWLSSSHQEVCIWQICWAVFRDWGAGQRGKGALMVKGLKSMWRQAAPILRTTLQGALQRIIMQVMPQKSQSLPFHAEH